MDIPTTTQGEILYKVDHNFKICSTVPTFHVNCQTQMQRFLPGAWQVELEEINAD